MPTAGRTWRMRKNRRSFAQARPSLEESSASACRTARWYGTSSPNFPGATKKEEIIGTYGTAKDITSIKEAEAKMESLHQQLLETSRRAGMAEVATSVLHNVGNVLNSVNVSASVMVDLLKSSRLPGLTRLAVMFEENKPTCRVFLPDRIAPSTS